MLSTVANAEIILSYECQIGEKPGSPNYFLEISNMNFTVRKTVGLSTREIQAKGVLTNEDVISLKKHLADLPPTLEVKDVGRISGSFRVRAKVKGKPIDINGSSFKKVMELEALTSWISSMHEKYPGLSGIRPLAPGDTSAFTY